MAQCLGLAPFRLWMTLSTARKLPLLAARHVKSGHVPSAELQMSRYTMVNFGNARDASQCVTVGGSARRSTGRSTSQLVDAKALLDGDTAFPDFFSYTVLARCSVFGWTWGEALVGLSVGRLGVFFSDLANGSGGERTSDLIQILHGLTPLVPLVFVRETCWAEALRSHTHPGMPP
jgi:hypothetical protein